MKKYPSLKDAPGFEPWKPAGAPVRGAGAGADDNVAQGDSDENRPWQRERVFKDIERHKYTSCSESEALASKDEWAALDRWHKAHPTPESTPIGQPIRLTGSAELSCEPQVSWSDMWNTLSALIPEDERQQVGDEGAPDTHANRANATDAQTNADKPAAGLAAHVCTSLRTSSPRLVRAALAGVKGAAQADLQVAEILQQTKLPHPNRATMATARSAALCNVVSHAGYTEKDRNHAVAADPASGALYVSQNLKKKGALFLIELEHFEGEFKLGLGRRTFNDSVDDDKKMEIEWYERSNKKDKKWSKQPKFKWTIRGYNGRRQTIGPTLSSEPISAFIDLEPKQTKGATEDQPRLKESVVTALQNNPRCVCASLSHEWRDLRTN